MDKKGYWNQKHAVPVESVDPMGASAAGALILRCTRIQYLEIHPQDPERYDKCTRKHRMSWDYGSSTYMRHVVADEFEEKVRVC